MFLKLSHFVSFQIAAISPGVEAHRLAFAWTAARRATRRNPRRTSRATTISLWKRRKWNYRERRRTPRWRRSGVESCRKRRMCDEGGAIIILPIFGHVLCLLSPLHWSAIAAILKDGTTWIILYSTSYWMRSGVLASNWLMVIWYRCLHMPFVYSVSSRERPWRHRICDASQQKVPSVGHAYFEILGKIACKISSRVAV